MGREDSSSISRTFIPLSPKEYFLYTFPLHSPPGTCQYDGLFDGDVLFGEVVVNFQNKKSLKPRFLSKQRILETKIFSAHSRREEGVRCYRI